MGRLCEEEGKRSGVWGEDEIWNNEDGKVREVCDDENSV